jgi:RNA polymerase-binding transcription factor DksA
MDQKKTKAFRERLLQKKQEILEAYHKNKSYGKEADGEATQDIADRRRTLTRRSSSSASRTRSGTCCSRWTKRSPASRAAATGSAPRARRT